jgi:hypothetical protein
MVVVVVVVVEDGQVEGSRNGWEGAQAGRRLINDKKCHLLN